MQSSVWREACDTDAGDVRSCLGVKNKEILLLSIHVSRINKVQFRRNGNRHYVARNVAGMLTKKFRYEQLQGWEP